MGEEPMSQGVTGQGVRMIVVDAVKSRMGLKEFF
jgi:hypothetical protein